MKAKLSLSLLLATTIAIGATNNAQTGAPALLQQELHRNARAAQAYAELNGDQISEVHRFFTELEGLKSNFELDVCELISTHSTAIEFLKKVIDADYLKISMLIEMSGTDSIDVIGESSTWTCAIDQSSSADSTENSVDTDAASTSASEDSVDAQFSE